ncbi:hypothetical protein CCU68_26580 [Pseudomonas gingeri NCPPB 3146 = LMG 5327]|uniref:Uncharacterized protein n=1 Tax=Pseudomonas gingeri NCPPB 3146 = LMG 5327 TaxID=707248 RepID=A0ABX4XZC3_9PSED|nr:hypothetical protein CCU68_26580 [Pseudomonas gingeri NCPPB 3146 = LMG 5327]
MLAMASGWAPQGSRASSPASRLLQVFWQGDILPSDTYCGSRLAGDGVRMDAASLRGLIAGKPAPTGERGASGLSAPRPSCCPPRLRPATAHPAAPRHSCARGSSR